MSEETSGTLACYFTHVNAPLACYIRRRLRLPEQAAITALRYTQASQSQTGPWPWQWATGSSRDFTRSGLRTRFVCLWLGCVVGQSVPKTLRITAVLCTMFSDSPLARRNMFRSVRFVLRSTNRLCCVLSLSLSFSLFFSSLRSSPRELCVCWRVPKSPPCTRREDLPIRKNQIYEPPKEIPPLLCQTGRGGEEGGGRERRESHTRAILSQGWKLETVVAVESVSEVVRDRVAALSRRYSGLSTA